MGTFDSGTLVPVSRRLSPVFPDAENAFRRIFVKCFLYKRYEIFHVLGKMFVFSVKKTDFILIAQICNRVKIDVFQGTASLIHHISERS